MADFCDTLAAQFGSPKAAAMPMAVVALLLAVVETATRVDPSKGALLTELVVEQLGKNFSTLCKECQDTSFVSSGAPASCDPLRPCRGRLPAARATHACMRTAHLLDCALLARFTCGELCKQRER